MERLPRRWFARTDGSERYTDYLKRFFSRQTPDFGRVLFIESGSRSISEKWLGWQQQNAPEASVDLITCYDGLPVRFNQERGSVFLTHDYPSMGSRDALVRALREKRYDIIGIVCSDEQIMTRWKWFLAWKLPAKVFIINENGDWFWLDRGSIQTLKQFVSIRSGLSGSGALRQPLKLLLFPFTLAYLAAFAAFIHLRRKVLS